MISTVDSDTRHADKTRERRQDGFRAHVVVEPDTGLSTAVRLTKTNGPANSDANVGAEVVVNDPTITEGDNVEVLGDSAYSTGDMLHTLDGKKWTPLVKPWPLRPAVAGGSTLDDFTHDPDAQTLTCPAGITRAVMVKGHATFGAACRNCPLVEQCTTAAGGRKIVLGEHHQLQRQHRIRAVDEGFQTPTALTCR